MSETYDLQIAEKLEELARLVRLNKLVSGEEHIDYEPLGNGQFLPTNYSISFTVVDERTKLPVIVTIETPVEKKND